MDAAIGDERPTLLVVEDDLGLRKQMRWSFDRYEVVFAEDRESAIAQLRRKIRSALTYPVILLCAAFILIGVLTTFAGGIWYVVRIVQSLGRPGDPHART